VLAVGTALGAAVAFNLATAGVAAAHVTANPETATKGGYGKIVFRVPDESPTAGTIKLQVTLPTDHPIASARTLAVPGWTVRIDAVAINPPITVHNTTISTAPHVITWTAQPGVRIGPTEFGEFAVSMGAFPDNVDRLVFPAVQTYDDGRVVNWDQVQQPGADEPEHPAPTVTLVDGPAEHGHMGMDMGGDETAHTDGDAPAGGGSADNTARWLGGIGLVLGALGLGLGGGALANSRRAGRSRGSDS
jgi:uncharacterized protein YcnI